MSGSSHSEATVSTELSELGDAVRTTNTNIVTTYTETKSHSNDSQNAVEDMDGDHSTINSNKSKQIKITNPITIDDGNAGIFTTERVTKVLKFHLMFILIAVVSLVILLYPIPIALYYTDPPATDLTNVPTSPLTCNEKWQLEPNTTLILEQCMMVYDYEDCENNNSAIYGLHSVYSLGELLNFSECYYDSLQFFCDATLLLCNGNSSSVDLTEECEEVRDNKCASEWRIVEKFYDRPVPDCMTYTEGVNLLFSKAPSFNCSRDLEAICGANCLPVCERKLLYTVFENDILVTYLIAIGIFGLIAGVITLIACFYNRQKLLKFPQIYILYNTLIWELFVFLEILPNFGRHSLFMCSSQNYLEAVTKPTIFCQTQGFLLQMVFYCFMGFWCFHSFHLFLSVAFPFKVKLWLDSSSCRRRIHIIEVTIVVVFSLIPPITTITASQYQDNGFYCFSQSPTILFYGELLPALFVICLGLIFLFSSFWVLRKQHHLKSRNISVSKVLCLGFSVGEFKLFLLFCYYGLTLVMYIVVLIVHIRGIDKLVATFDDYIVCSAQGSNNTCQDLHKRYEDAYFPLFVLGVVIHTLFSVINISHLVYVIHFQTVKKSHC